MQAYRLPKETQEQTVERSRAIEQTTLGAIRVPLEVAHMSVEVLELAMRVVARGNRNALCDGGTAAALARAALTGASLNVQTNTDTLQDRSSVNSLLSELKALDGRSRA
jgi:formiminotetrahydrofolate cyclodeaminase